MNIVENVSVVMPFRNGFEYAKEAIDSMLDTDIGSELIIVSDDSERIETDKLISYVKSISGKGFTVTLLLNNVRGGFPKTVNRGVAESTQDNICVVNSDLVFTPNWLSTMMKYITNGVHMVGPRTNYSAGCQRLAWPKFYRNKQELYDMALDYSAMRANNYTLANWIIGFCILFTRRMWDTLEGFDERFGLGNSEDIDLCFRARELDFTIAIVEDVYVHHFGSISHGINGIAGEVYTALLKENHEKLVDKLGKAVVDRYYPSQIIGDTEVLS